MTVRYWSNYISVRTFSRYVKQSQNLNIVTNLEISARSCPEKWTYGHPKQTAYKNWKLRKLKKALFLNFLNYWKKKVVSTKIMFLHMDKILISLHFKQLSLVLTLHKCDHNQTYT